MFLTNCGDLWMNCSRLLYSVQPAGYKRELRLFHVQLTEREMFLQ